jgi:hypothetical protein
MSINTFNNMVIIPTIVSFQKVYGILIINREFSSGRVLFKPIRDDISVFSENTTEKDLQEPSRASGKKNG